MSFRDSYLCLAPTRGPLRCGRPVLRPGDHCYQHGGRWRHPLVIRFLAGESIEDLAYTLNPDKPAAERIAWVERLLRKDGR